MTKPFLCINITMQNILFKIFGHEHLGMKRFCRWRTAEYLINTRGTVITDKEILLSNHTRDIVGLQKHKKG